MDSMSIKDVVLEKKLNTYSSNEDNFKVSQELTVEITLNEYRGLVRSDATRKEAIDKANSDKYERENKIKELTAQVESLKAENYELKKALEEANNGRD